MQKLKGREGELWGLANLLELTTDTIQIMDTIEEHNRKERGMAEQLAGLLERDYQPPSPAATGALAVMDRQLVPAAPTRPTCMPVPAECIRTINWRLDESS